MMAAAILAAAPALLTFACVGDGDPQGVRKFELHYREVRPDHHNDIRLKDLSMSGWEGKSGFLQKYFVDQRIHGRMTPTGSIEIFSKAAEDRSAHAWLRFNSADRRNKMDFEARFSAIALGHIGLSEEVSGVCVMSTSRTAQ